MGGRNALSAVVYSFWVWLVLGLSYEPSATAQSRSTDAPALNWVRLKGAEECIAPQALAIKVETRLGREIFVSSAAAEFVIEGTIGPRSIGGWHAVLVMSDSSGKILGSRELISDSETCSALDEALALVIAVTLYPQLGLSSSAIPLPEEIISHLDRLFAGEPKEFDPDLDAESPDRTVKGNRIPRKYSRKPTDSASDTNELPSTTRDPYRSWDAVLAFGTGMGVGMTPSLSSGIGVLLRLNLPGIWPLDIRSNYWFGSADENEQVKVDVSMVAANFGLCPLSYRSGYIGFWLCGGLEVGALITNSRGFYQDSMSPLAPLWGTYGGVVGQYLINELVAIWAGATVVVPVVRQRLTYRISKQSDPMHFFTQGIITARLEFGFDINFF